MWIFFLQFFFFFLSNIHMNTALFRHFHMNSEICFPFFAILFCFFWHYLHEESFFFCIVFSIVSLFIWTVNSFFNIHIIIFYCWCFFFFFFALLTWTIYFILFFALLLQLMSLFNWIVHFFQYFFTIHMIDAIFSIAYINSDIFFPAIVLHYSHQQSILVKKNSTLFT